MVLVALLLVPDERPDASTCGIAGLLLAGVEAGYVRLGLPTFIAGLALTAVRRISTPAVAVCTAGMLSAAAYFATLGTHLLPRAGADHLVLVTGLSAFIGTALGSRRL